MAASTRLTTTGQQAARPFDARLSAHLDDLVLQLEQNPNRWRRRILKLKKLIAERHIPAGELEVRPW